jgi:putative nucleotidyltransferase with HDIG domain
VLPASPAHSPEEQSAQAQEAWLNEQREAAQRCERQYGEAARVMRDINEQLSQQPKEAGRTAGDLTRAMLDKMLAAEEVGIRLVSGSGSDRNGAHALNVAVISMLIGRTLGMSGHEMQDMGVGALLHDVGKVDVPDRLRHPEDNFTPAEANGYRDHVAKGVLQGHRMGLSAGALSVIAQHHEHADGSGFPMKLSADEARIDAPRWKVMNTSTGGRTLGSTWADWKT